MEDLIDKKKQQEEEPTETTVEASESSHDNGIFQPFTGLFGWAWGGGGAAPQEKQPPKDDGAQQVLDDTKALLAEIPDRRPTHISECSRVEEEEEKSDENSQENKESPPPSASVRQPDDPQESPVSLAAEDEDNTSVSNVSGVSDAVKGDDESSVHSAPESEDDAQFVPYGSESGARQPSFELSVSTTPLDDDDMSSLGGDDEQDHVIIEEEEEEEASYIEYELPSDDELTEVTIREEELDEAAVSLVSEHEEDADTEVSCDDSSSEASSCHSPEHESDVDSSTWDDSESECSEEEENSDWERNFVYPKTIPSPTNSYSTVSLSFLAEKVPTGVASKVFLESLRILRPGGIIFVVDVNGATVNRLPLMRQMLSRVHDPDEMEEHEVQMQELLQTNGFDGERLIDGQPIVRWYGIKSEEDDEHEFQPVATGQ